MHTFEEKVWFSHQMTEFNSSAKPKQVWREALATWACSKSPGAHELEEGAAVLGGLCSPLTAHIGCVWAHRRCSSGRDPCGVGHNWSALAAAAAACITSAASRQCGSYDFSVERTAEKWSPGRGARPQRDHGWGRLHWMASQAHCHHLLSKKWNYLLFLQCLSSTLCREI